MAEPSMSGVFFRSLLCVAGVALLTGVPSSLAQNSPEKPVEVVSLVAPKPFAPLQGGVEIRQHRNEPNYELIAASRAYDRAAYELQLQHYKLAADLYKEAGDKFAAVLGEGKALANARYGEAGARMLAREDARAAELFQQSAELFGRHDPGNPFLKASLEYKQKIQRKLQGTAGTSNKKLITMVPKLDKVDRNVTLNGRLTKLEDGTRLVDLKVTDFFNGSRHMLPQAAALDIPELFVKETIYKAFLKMDCLEFAALGSNYMTANNNYKTFIADDKPVAIGASDQFWSPVVKLKINNKEYGVAMDLPGIAKNSRNVLLATDGNHVIAIDPRTSDTWKLVTSFTPKGAEFNWWKLTHIKKPSIKR